MSWSGGGQGLALLSDAKVMAWGDNLEGQLGNATNTSSNLPVAVKGLAGVKAVSAGFEHGLAQK
jgi:alpha-tubulin suppressor-like RCC1 family protein